MELLVGAILAAGTVASGSIIGFDRERGFYPVLLFVIATYYLLFAAMGSAPGSFLPEAAGVAIFGALSIGGYKKTLWLVVAGLLGHAVFDLFHHVVISNPSVPVFWPGFCAVFDCILAGYLAILLARRRLDAPAR